MINVLLKKDYKENKKGDIISVSNNIAFGLIDNGIGEAASVRDFATEAPLGVTKAFGRAPSSYNKPKKKR